MVPGTDRHAAAYESPRGSPAWKLVRTTRVHSRSSLLDVRLPVVRSRRPVPGPRRSGYAVLAGQQQVFVVSVRDRRPCMTTRESRPQETPGSAADRARWPGMAV